MDAVRRYRRGESCSDTRLDPVAGWALRVVGLAVVVPYLLSVYAKFANAGISWVTEPILATSLRHSANPISQWLSEFLWLLVIFQAMTLIIEALSFLAFTGGWKRNLVLGSLGTFHLVSYALLGTEFLGFLICYLAFFRLEEGLAWARGLLADDRNRRRTGPSWTQ